MRFAPVWLLLSLPPSLASALPQGLVSPSPSQAGSAVHGTVTSEPGVGIAGAIVTLEPLGLIEHTDQNGAFAFNGVPEGVYLVIISSGPFEARDADVQVVSGKTVRLAKRLPQDFRLSMTTTVNAASRVQEQRLEAPVAMSVIDEKTIALEGGAGQLPSLLQSAAGAEYAQSSLYNIEFNARGFNSNLSRRVQVLLDGRNLAAPENKSQEWISLGFLASELERIEFVRGPAAALYGANSINGVIAMTTTSPRATPGGRARITTGELDTFIGDLRWAGPLGREWYAKFVVNRTQSSTFSRSRTETVEYPGLPLDIAPAFIDVESTSANARFDKYLTGGRQLVLEGGYSQNNGGTVLSQAGRFGITDSKRSWSRVNLNATHWMAHAYLNTRRGDQQALFAPLRYPTASVQFRGEVNGNRHFAQARGRVVFGGSYLQEHVDSADDAGVQTLYQRAVTTKEAGLFGQLGYDLSSRLKVVAALRWDESTLHPAQVSPKVALVYLPVPDQSLRVTVDRGFQVGNYTELFLSSPLAAPLDLSAVESLFAPLLGGVPLGFGVVPVNAFGNVNLDVEKVRSVEFGYVGSFGSRARLSIDVYRNTMRDFISDILPGTNPAYPAYRAPAALPPAARAVVEQTLNATIPGLTNRPDGGPQVVYSYGNVGLVKTWGVEVEGTFRPFPELALDASSTWFDFTLIDPTPGLEPKPNSPRNRLAFGATYQRPRFAASFRHRLVQRFTWASGLYVGPVPRYNVSDVNVSYAVTAHWQLGANISNVFDQAHYEMFGGDILRRRALGHLTFDW